MANIKEVRDDGADPGCPTIEEMRENQEAGNKGIGLNENSYADDLKDFNREAGSPSTANDSDATPSPDVEPRAWLP